MFELIPDRFAEVEASLAWLARFLIKANWSREKNSLKGPVTYLLKPLLGKNFGGVAWTPFVMHWSFYSTVLPGDMQI